MGDRGPHSAEIRHMAEQEKDHRAKFDALLVKRGVRPTMLHPFWSAAGYALGAGTALLGPEAAMACTAASKPRSTSITASSLTGWLTVGLTPNWPT